jgi:uncharacterized protein YcbK (DUF882 family)
MGDISKNFNRREFSCPDQCGFDVVDAELLKILQILRDRFNRKVIINSGCRCLKYNTKRKGSQYSQHLFGKAADITVEHIWPVTVYDYLDQVYPISYGIGLYDTFVHIDVRSKKTRWGF